MAVDAKLKNRLQVKLGVGSRQIDRLITERARTLLLPREQAAIALALELRVNVTRFATAEDLTAIRSAAAGQAGPATSPESTRSDIRPSRSAIPADRRTGRTAKRRNRKVFVVHGRDDSKRRAVFAFLRALGLAPVEWSQALRSTHQGSPYVGQILDRALSEAAAIVVLLTPDDVARLKKSFQKPSDPDYETRLTGQPRPNVLFEAGMALGRHENRTVLVQLGSIRPFSDIGGRHVVRLSNHAERRQEFANKLDAAGCKVDLTGTDWLSEGDFG